MAEIPMGRFDQARMLPQAGRSNVQLGDSRALAQAADRLAGAFDQVANVAMRRQQEDQQESAALARAKAQNAVLDDDIELQGIATDIQQRIADGSLHYDQADEELQTRLSTRERPEILDLDEVGQVNYERALERNRFTTTTAVDGIVKTARRADFKSQIVGTRDRLAKFASDPNADVDRIVRGGSELRQLAAQGGLLDNFEKDQQDFSDKVYTDNAKARLVTGRDDLDALASLEKDLTSEGGRYFGKLDADKTNALLTQIQTRRAQLEAKAETDSRKGESAADRVLGAFEKQIASTLPAPDDTMVSWSETMKLGTPEQQEQWNELLKSEIEVRRVLTLPPAQQRAYVQGQRAKQATEGATVQQQANLARMETVVEHNAKELREQPLVAAERLTGDAVPDLDMQALMAGDVGKVKGQIATRLDTLTAMRKNYGDEVGVVPLKPQEAEQLAAALGKATPTQAAQFFGTLSSLFDDKEAYRAAMQQIAPDSPVRAYAGIAFLDRPDVSRLMLEGETLVNKTKADKSADGKGGTFPLPTPDTMRKGMADLVGTAFAQRGASYEQAQQAVRAYYAATASRDGDVSGELDQDRLQQAVHQVIGTPVDINGADVLPPFGMDEDVFVESLEAHWPQVVATVPQGFSRDFDDYTLLPASGSRYFVLGAAGKFLHDQSGRPVQIDVRAPLVPKSQAESRHIPQPDFSTWKGGAKGL